MNKKTILLLFIFIIIVSFVNASEPEIKIHYLGHAAFIIQCDNGFSIVTDYGFSNAYNLGNIIYDVGNLKPNIVTYSHQHLDHYGKITDAEHILLDQATLELDGITIAPVKTSEAYVGAKDNSSFIINYKGMTIVHLGDAQANISNIKTKNGRKFLKKHFPEKIDILLMTIGKSGLHDITLSQVESTIKVLNPKIVIPMHYWNETEKENFLQLLAEKKDVYQIEKHNNAKFENLKQKSEKIQVISLTPTIFID